MFDIFLLSGDNEITFYDPNDDALQLLNPKLTLELGKAGALEFTLPPNHEFLGHLKQLMSYFIVRSDTEDEIFRGRVLSDKLLFNGCHDVYIEGMLSCLVDSVQKPKKYTGEAAKNVFKDIVDAHNSMFTKTSPKRFEVGTIDNEFANVQVYLAGKSDEIRDQLTSKFDYRQIAINASTTEWQTTYDYLESTLLNYCGGYLRVRRGTKKDDQGNTVPCNRLDWRKSFGKSTSQAIELGVNMLDLTKELNVEDMFTCLIPLGDDNLTIEKQPASSSGAAITHAAGSPMLVDKAAVDKYGRIVKTNVFSNVNNAATLYENGVRYLQNHTNIPITFEIQAIDMHLVDSRVTMISLGDKVRVVSELHDLTDEDDIFTCTKIEYDLANPENTVYTFGDPKPSLTERYREDVQKQAGAGGGGGGGGGGGAAAETAEEEAEKNTKEIYDAWITYDKDTATIDIGALYKKLTGKDRHFNEVGIDMGAESGTVNIHSMSTNLETDEKHMAEIYTWAGIEKFDETTGKPVFSTKIGLNADVVKIKSRVTTIDSDLVEVQGKLKAVSVDANTMTVALALTASGLGANDVQAKNRFLLGKTDIMTHKHAFSIDGSGKVTLGEAYLGNAPAGTSASFNIADTDYYKSHAGDTVSAVYYNSGPYNGPFGQKYLNVSVNLSKGGYAGTWSVYY